MSYFAQFIQNIVQIGNRDKAITRTEFLGFVTKLKISVTRNLNK